MKRQLLFHLTVVLCTITAVVFFMCYCCPQQMMLLTNVNKTKTLFPLIDSSQ